MSCACGTEEKFDSVDTDHGVETVIDNGRECDCRTFTCNRCADANIVAYPGFDPALCAECNTAYEFAAPAASVAA